MLQSVGFVPALGYAYIVSAHIASAGGDIDTAREHLDSALACCLEMGNDTQADEVRRLIDSLASSSTSHAGPH